MFDSPIVEEPSRVADDRPRGGRSPGGLMVGEFDDRFGDPYGHLPVEPGAAPFAPLAPTTATCEPSGWLALELDSGTADLAVMSDVTLIESMVGFDRVASWAAARQARLLAELARRRPADAVPNEERASAGSRFAPDEVAVALKLSRGTAAGRIATACRLLRVLPDTHALWESGRIDAAKARAIDEATTVLSDELAAEVEARVLPRAAEQSLAQLRAALARAVLAVDPDGAADRHREARKDRRVHVQPEADGMGSLWALLTASDAAGAYAWLTRLARGLGKDDPRTMDARRADLLAELLNGRLVPDVEWVEHGPDDGPAPDPDGIPERQTTTDESMARAGAGDGVPCGTPSHRAPVRPVTPGKPLIQVVMSYSTLIGADDQPADLVGHGPIPADLAREIAADGVWRRLVTDPLSGTVLDYGRTTYHPPAGLADHVRVRDQHCRFPHCRRRAADAELDHVVGWAEGGPTDATNLRSLCVHHHKLKTHAGWRVEGRPDGRLTWITPTGHRHTTAPWDYGPEPPPPHAASSDTASSGTASSPRASSAAASATAASLAGHGWTADSGLGQAADGPDPNPPPF